MADLPYIRLWVDDYLADTYHLSLEEHGAYVMLLMLAWRTPGCSLPNDPDWIARRLRISVEEFDRVVSPILLEFFTRRSNRLHQKRLSVEFASARERSQKQSGRVKSRWLKEKDGYRGNTIHSHSHSHNQRERGAESSPSPLKKDPASPDHASRTSAEGGGVAQGSPPPQDQTNNLPDLEPVLAYRRELYPDDEPIADIAARYRAALANIIDSLASEIGDNSRPLATKLLRFRGPAAALAALEAIQIGSGKDMTPIDEPRAYVASLINGKAKP